MSKKSRSQRSRRRLFAEQLEDRRVMSADASVLPEWFGDRADDLSPSDADESTAPIVEVTWRGTQTEAHADQWIIQISDRLLGRIHSFEQAANTLGENGPVRAVQGLGQAGLIMVEGNSLHGQELQAWLGNQAFIESYEPNQVISCGSDSDVRVIAR